MAIVFEKKINQLFDDSEIVKHFEIRQYQCLKKYHFDKIAIIHNITLESEKIVEIPKKLRFSI